MKKPPILTAAVVLVFLWSFRGLAAWQAADPSTDTASSAAPDGTLQPSAANGSSAPLELVREARERLANWQSVQADIEQMVALGPYRFRSTGSYLAGSDLRYRLEYRLELRGFQGQFLEVSDGQVLHTRREVTEINPALTSTSSSRMELTRREIQKILRAYRDLTPTADAIDASLAAQIGLGGLPAVLASLERSMVFDGLRPETVEGREYLVVQGRWNERRRTEILSGMEQMAGQIATFMPHRVRVYFAKETLFPEKILYLKQASEERQTFLPMLTIEFKNVVLNQPIPPQKFAYALPAGGEERDDTSTFVQLLQQTTQPRANSPASQPAPPPTQ